MHIELRHIHKRFGAVHASNDINLTFDTGRIVGVLGENGAGKSTLMKILAGYQPADSGEILLDGRPAAYHGIQAAIAAGIGMLQQDPLDIAAFTVLENFMYGGLPVSRKAAREQLFQLCQRFGFVLNPDQSVSQLSIAGRQQLEIIRLLALGVRILILDEPTTGISTAQKQILFSTLRDLVTRDGMSVLLVSHKLEDVIALCDEVVILRAGQLVGARNMPATTIDLVQMMFGTQTVPAVTVEQRLSSVRDTRPDALKLDRATLQSGRITIDHLTLNIKAGEIVGFAGLEGSGQELVLRACAGLASLRHGEISVAQRHMTGKRYRDFMRAGVIFAAAGRLEEGLIAGLTLTEHLALMTDNHFQINWTQARQKTEAVIKQYQVRGTPESAIETLSGGNQQRMLMGLLPVQPTALILEQPMRGLDVDSARWIWEQLLMRRDKGAALVFSSPELDEILEYSDRIIVFYAGKTFEVTDPDSTTIEDLGYLIGGKEKLA
ncbi:MAG TPA: ATP-binding cassette domain-containing protein [Phototrophicaceae bacterium]|jgi:simple sugar transport system ATP-binding protein|nr:ATP-binding cassette domain-containing protein [Phototrophicaceae bacterium]